MHGQLRTGILAFPNLRHFFGDLFESCDFFIHTWDSNIHRTVMGMNNQRRVPEKVLEEELINYKNLYSSKKFVVENQNEFFYPLTQKYGHVGELINLYHSFHKSVQLKKEYEIENNFKYDTVVRLRPDILFPINRSFKKDLDEYLADISKIYSCRGDDFYHIGSSSNMDISGNFYVQNPTDNYTQWPLQTFINYLTANDIKFVKLNDGRFTILRPESAYMNVILSYDQICLLNAHLYDNIFNSTQDIYKFYMNENSEDWVKDMFDIFEKLFDKTVFEKLQNNLNFLPRKSKK